MRARHGSRERRVVVQGLRGGARGAATGPPGFPAPVTLDGAFLVNPHDIDGLKRTMLAAMRIEPAEAEERMRRLREHVLAHDVHRWAREFLETLRWA